MKRKSLSKRVRFEVFKRDSFKRQYCGASSPDVLLHVDHIQPVAQGGQSDIANLVTACESCNLGKSDKALSDTTAAKKRKNQLDKLQERREQLEMMSQWQSGMLNLAEEEVAECHRLWQAITKNFHLTETGLENLRKLIKKFGVRDVMNAMRRSEKYLDVGQDGRYTGDSVGLAFSKIGGICIVERRALEDPEIHEIYKIRAMLMGRIPSLKPWDASAKLNNLRRVGYTAAEIRSHMEKVERWWQFQDTVDAMLAEVQ